jgi:hypothetical protein
VRPHRSGSFRKADPLAGDLLRSRADPFLLPFFWHLMSFPWTPVCSVIAVSLCLVSVPEPVWCFWACAPSGTAAQEFLCSHVLAALHFLPAPLSQGPSVFFVPLCFNVSLFSSPAHALSLSPPPSLPLSSKLFCWLCFFSYFSSLYLLFIFHSWIQKMKFVILVIFMKSNFIGINLQLKMSVSHFVFDIYLFT